MLHYNKLIRDKIPDRELKEGKQITYHAASTDEEVWFMLRTKLQEEIAEFGDDATMEQIADVWDVLEAIMKFKKFDEKEVNAIRENKRIELGGFDKHWVLELSEESMGENMLDRLL